MIFDMYFSILLLLFGSVATQERDKFCIAAKPPLALPGCTKQCLIGEGKVLDGNCADNLEGFCELSDVVHIHFNMYGAIDYVNMFKAACKGTHEDYFENEFNYGGNEFNYKDLLTGKPSGSIAASTKDSATNFEAMSTYETTIEILTSNTPSPSTSTSASSSSETEKSSEAPSPPPATSTPAAAPSSTNEGKPTSVVAAPAPSNTIPPNDVTIQSHVHITISNSELPALTNTHAAEPTLSTTSIAGIAAGGTVAIALIIGLVFFFLRRRKHRASLASSADIWEPSRNTSPNPKLPVIENDSSFGRHSKVEAGPQMHQHSKAELHSESAPPPPRPQTAHNGYPNPPEIRGGSGNESSRFYRPAQPSHLHRHGSNMDSRYPELGSHAAPSIPSPASPVSASSTVQGWHANTPSEVPISRMSSADLRTEGMRSPVSELGTNTPLRSTRSAELHGAEITSPISELGSDTFSSGGNGVAELHTDPVLPSKLGPGNRGDMTAVIAEMEGSHIQKGHRHGLSTNS
ncbi:hypothetical protein AA0117_g2840 [Alternaria alternata]|uniref:Extracellular membrane protein CFEM domain-containing protein n=1 Tax=Alternaria alternata TaxID=5599 RepID=A0A4Q4NPA2_ALTAL|nr:hypothetical protein AA0117_g2840 [Alternaria alternata]